MDVIFRRSEFYIKTPDGVVTDFKEYVELPDFAERNILEMLEKSSKALLLIECEKLSNSLVEFCADYITNWTGLEESGVVIPCNRAAIERVISDHTWIGTQIADHILRTTQLSSYIYCVEKDANNFIKGLSKIQGDVYE